MITLPTHLFEQICTHVITDSPNEACGYVEGPDYGTPTTHRPMVNAHSNPTHGYRYDPEEQAAHWANMLETGTRPALFYHSHTRGSLHPSREDTTTMLRYPDSHHMILLVVRTSVLTQMYTVENGSVVATTCRFGD